MIDDRNVYTNSYKIESYLCDEDDRLSLWGLSRLMQTVAEEHTILTHISYFDLIAKDKAWVLSRMYYVIERMPAYGEVVQFSTWSRGNDGLFNARDYRVFDHEGKVLATASAYWVVIDFTARRVCRLDSIMEGYVHHTECATDKQRLAKLRLQPFGDADRVDSFKVKPSMLDHTRHVNNSEYVKWIDDLRPDGTAVCDLEIDFLAETRRGEEVAVYRQKAEDGGKWQYRIDNNRGVSITAQVGVVAADVREDS